MVNAKQILDYLTLNKDRFKEQYHLTKIGIFGSLAREEHTSKSDIDLIVEFEDNTQDLYNIKLQIKSEIQTFRSHILSEAKYA